MLEQLTIAGPVVHVGGFESTGDFRVAALCRGWEEPLAEEPSGVYIHDDGRPPLGRELKGKSERELRVLGLVPEDAEGAESNRKRSG